MKKTKAQERKGQNKSGLGKYSKYFLQLSQIKPYQKKLSAFRFIFITAKAPLIMEIKLLGLYFAKFHTIFKYLKIFLVHKGFKFYI